MTLAFAVMAIGYQRYWRGIRRRQVFSGALVGLCLAIGYQFQTLGLARTTPSKSAFITGLMVVLVPLLSAIPGLRPPGGHAPRWNAFFGAALALGDLEQAGGRPTKWLWKGFLAAGEVIISTPFSASALYAEDPHILDDPRIAPPLDGRCCGVRS